MANEQDSVSQNSSYFHFQIGWVCVNTYIYTFKEKRKTKKKSRERERERMVKNIKRVCFYKQKREKEREDRKAKSLL